MRTDVSKVEYNHLVHCNMFLAIVILSLSIQWGQCDKVSPKPGLKIFREDYKSVEETCFAVGFVSKNCRNETNTDDRFYAFDARVGTSIKNLAVNGRVVFNTVVSNHGLGYNASSGIFTAHRSGIYVFDWTILPWQGSNAHTAITLNDKFQSWSYCDSGKSGILQSCSKMAVLKLQRGDKVWIAVFRGQAVIHSTFSSFSGYKL